MARQLRDSSTARRITKCKTACDGGSPDTLGFDRPNRSEGMDTAEAAAMVRQLIADVGSIRRDGVGFDAWRRKYHAVLDRLFGEGSKQLAAVESVNYQFSGLSTLGDSRPHIQAFQDGLHEAKGVLETIAWELEQFGVPQNVAPAAPLHDVETICSRFHHVCRQLRQRHEGRVTLDVADEYDVQDLLHALLRLYFDDVRDEEWTPSYAGGASRMDFLLKREAIVVECKKTRRGLTARKIGEELTIDIARYKSHPDCRILVCFVYDPDGQIANPSGLEHDLSTENDKFSVKVIIPH
jgi:hypothetical protein